MTNGDKEEVFLYHATMGRKSNTKKQIRAILKDDKKSNGKAKKISKKDLKKELQVQPVQYEPPVEKQPRFVKLKEKLEIVKTHKKKIFGGVLVLIMGVLLISFSYLLFQKTFRPAPIASLLPEKQTVALVEMNINPDHNQVIKALSLLKKHQDYNLDALLNYTSQKLTLDYKADLKPWLGRQMGVAYLNSEENTINEIYFLEVANKPAADKFLSTKSPKIFTAYVDDYLVITKTESALKQLKFSDDLYHSDKYRRIDDNLPIQRLGLFYLDFENMTDSFFKHFTFLSEKGLSTQKMGPLLNSLDAEGMALIALEDKLAVQSFLSLDEEIVDTLQYLPTKAKYEANLTKYLPANTLIFWGGENVGNQLKRLSEIMAGGDPLNITIFDQLVQNYTAQYFGGDINFNRDILPLVENEFAFSIEKNNQQQIYKFLLKLDDPQKDKVKLQELANNFASIGAVFKPKVVETILQDGTVSREIVAVPEEVTKSESTYENQQIFELKLGDKDFGLYYTFLEDVAVFSSQKAGIVSTLDTLKKGPEGQAQNLQSSALFQNTIGPVLRNADEVSYFEFATISGLLGSQEEWPKFITIIDAVSTGRNYFNDGIITLNYLHLN